MLLVDYRFPIRRSNEDVKPLTEKSLNFVSGYLIASKQGECCYYLLDSCTCSDLFHVTSHFHSGIHGRLFFVRAPRTSRKTRWTAVVASFSCAAIVFSSFINSLPMPRAQPPCCQWRRNLNQHQGMWRSFTIRLFKGVYIYKQCDYKSLVEDAW